jgi:hypothetical protein
MPIHHGGETPTPRPEWSAWPRAYPDRGATTDLAPTETKLP